MGNSILEKFAVKDTEATTVKNANIDRSELPEVEQPNAKTSEAETVEKVAEKVAEKNAPNMPTPNLPNGGGINPNGGGGGGGGGVSQEVQTVNLAAGEMILESYDFLKPVTFAAYLDENPELFEMSSFKKKKLQNIFNIYFKTLEKPINEKAIFWSTVVLTLGGDFAEFMAYKKKKKRGETIGKKSAAKPAKPENKEPEKKTEPETENENDNEEETPELNENSYPNRSRFDVDKDGYFIYPEGDYNYATRNRLLKSQRVEKADPEIFDMWVNKGMKNKAIKKELGIE